MYQMSKQFLLSRGPLSKTDRVQAAVWFQGKLMFIVFNSLKTFELLIFELYFKNVLLLF